MMVARREILALPALAARASDPPVRRRIFLRSPRSGTAVWCYAYYAAARGGELISIEQRLSRSDTIDVAYLRRSKDNGRTWSEPIETATGEKRAGGMWRLHLRAGFVDPVSRKLIEFWNEGVLPTDDPLEGLRQWNIRYRVDGRVHDLVQEGAEFSAEHPLPGVWRGKNCAMIGDQACTPLAGRRGGVLLPVSVTPIDAQGRLYNPGGGYTYHDAAVLHGRFERGRYVWRMSERLVADPKRSTRGLDEPSIAWLRGGRLLMVMRGSNDRQTVLPARRWYSISSDGGLTWPQAEPWSFSNGEPFYSPSACAQLLPHSSGRLFWLGNISRENARGNRPRYPFWIGEVDPGSGLLKKESMRVVDDLAEGEDPILMLSNFYAREDRESHEIVLHMSRLFAHPDNWQGDAYEYRIPV